jgi:hypothetical protein
LNSVTNTSPFRLEDDEWVAWKENTIEQLLGYYNLLTQMADKSYNNASRAVFAGKRVEEFESRLEIQLLRPKDLIQQEEFLSSIEGLHIE